MEASAILSFLKYFFWTPLIGWVVYLKRKDKEALETLKEKVIKLEEQQEKTKSYRNEYYRVKYKEYVKRFDAIKKSQSQDLWLELIGIIEYIALRESFSVVLRIDDPYVVFYTKDVDITDEVVKEINARRRKNR